MFQGRIEQKNNNSVLTSLEPNCFKTYETKEEALLAIRKNADDHYRWDLFSKNDVTISLIIAEKSQCPCCNQNVWKDIHMEDYYFAS